MERNLVPSTPNLLQVNNNDSFLHEKITWNKKGTEGELSDVDFADSISLPDSLGRNGLRRDLHSSSCNLTLAKSTDEITYTWTNINVWTSRAHGTDSVTKDFEPGTCFRNEDKPAKHILRNVSGIVRPGELLAIIGASGAGKSTMLNVLNFRNMGNLKVTGERAVNGVPLGPNSLTSLSAYIQQHDLFVGSLTVREHLVFQALVRMHSHIPYKVRLQRVEEVIQDLGLSKCAETQIGSPGRVKGISGGEMKRLAFASEVLTDPPLMFCDEPTSGLDSYMSQNIVSLLKTLTGRGKTILCTIHQPSSQIFKMFDRILLMADGRVAFMGETAKAIPFFEKNGHSCPPNYNPSDFFIEKLAIRKVNESEHNNCIAQICESYLDSEEGKEIQRLTSMRRADPAAEAYLKQEAKFHLRSPYKATWYEQFRAVLWRCWLSNVRDPFFIRIKFYQALVMSLTVGIVFLGQKFNQDGVQNINGANFIVMMNLSYGNAVGTVHIFCSELSLFLREHFNGMYRTDVYFLAKMFAELPFFVLFPLMVGCIVYFMVGLQLQLDAFFITAGIYILVANCAVSIGYFVSCYSSNEAMARTIVPSLIVPLVLVGGWFMNTGSIPTYLIWAKYISWFHYGNEAVTIAQWRNVESITCNRENSTCPANGRVVLKALHFQEGDLMLDVFALIGLVVLLRFMAFLALLRKTYRKNN